MSDHFMPPGDESPLESGAVDIGAALLTAVYGLRRNALIWVATVILCFVAYFASICTCVGWIFVVPPMVWIVYAMTLESNRGETTLGGTEPMAFANYAVVLRRVWGWLGIWILLALPLYIFIGGGLLGFYGLDGLLVALQTPQFNVMLTPIMTAFGVVATALFARIYLVPYLLVDRDLPVVEAFVESWRMSEGNWLRLMGILYVVTACNLPATMIQLGTQYYVANLPVTEQVVLWLPQTGISVIVGVWSVLMSLVGLCAMGAAYDQLRGRSVGAVAA